MCTNLHVRCMRTTCGLSKPFCFCFLIGPHSSRGGVGRGDLVNRDKTSTKRRENITVDLLRERTRALLHVCSGGLVKLLNGPVVATATSLLAVVGVCSRAEVQTNWLFENLAQHTHLHSCVKISAARSHTHTHIAQEANRNYWRSLRPHSSCKKPRREVEPCSPVSVHTHSEVAAATVCNNISSKRWWPWFHVNIARAVYI